MACLQVTQLCLAYGLQPLLKDVSFAVDKGERIALLGRNGEGKSTLLRVLAGLVPPDSGEIRQTGDVRIAYLPQDPPRGDDKTVAMVLKEAFAEVEAMIQRYHALSHDWQADKAQELAHLEEMIHHLDGWNIDALLASVMQEFELDGNALMKSLSGGWRRRVWLARVLLEKPDILLLDEPTNHLDINSILWLEQFLLRFSGTSIFVTHDRAFLEKLATRVWHLDRGRLLDVKGDYPRFLRTQEEVENADALAQARFEKKLSEEEVWIRKGIQARRTRNEGRVRALKAMRRENEARIKKQGKANFSLNEGQRSSRQVIVAEDVSFAYDHQPSLIQQFSDIIERGEKIALIGANGVGKTTLIQLLLGSITPQTGTVERADNLSIVYVDQLRAQLDEEKTLRENVSEGSDYIDINGRRVHIASYLQDFLFAPERWNTPVKVLSGGEKARLLLAKLFVQPSNILVLDEPTNDLDIETLELLEERLQDYSGTLLLVSHDRRFVDSVATRSWVFDQKHQKLIPVAGGFETYLSQGGDLQNLLPAQKEEHTPPPPVKESPAPSKKSSKLSYKYQRELEQLPALIESLEEEIAQLQDEVNQPDFYTQDFSVQEKTLLLLEEKNQQLEVAMDRWLALENGEV